MSAPDIFYLGQLPNMSGSFCARLDSLHTINLSSKPQDRTVLVEGKRVARLSIEFARDLHLRLTRAYSSLGFDDISWFTDDDLKSVLLVGQRDRAKLTAEILDLERQIHIGETQSFANPNHKDQLNKKRTGLQQKLESFNAVLFPFENELTIRNLRLS